VFPLLRGLVIETGGKLSHGAILAREYSIPAVGGVTGATSSITDRTEIEVDGNTGSVIVEGGVRHGFTPGVPGTPAAATRQVSA
jgi:phosphoenolpyruvate-protein kinase (PTS system EI component)